MYATRPRRRFPFFFGVPFFAAGLIAASLIGSAGAALGLLLFLPLLAFKFMFMFFVFGAFMRMFAGGLARRGPYGHWRHDGFGDRAQPRREPTQEERDWAEARRRAREEIEDLFPDETD
ncbi:MAG: hypothetical protein HKN24_14305 [Acidimicrobiales bacterium]|nr:hypothetical protein [Acidimicrobiales bacterium]